MKETTLPKNLRILHLPASDIYYAISNSLPLEKETGKWIVSRKYADSLSPSLDLYHLLSKKKLIILRYENLRYTNDFVNVSFKYPLYIDENGKQVVPKRGEKADSAWNKKIGSEMRKELYLNGFTLNEKKYVRYKRSAGAAKGGSCLFIREELFKELDSWSLMGLDREICEKNLTAYEAYRALSLSSLIATLDLEPKNILFVEDAKISLPHQKVIKVTYDGEKLVANEEDDATVENNIFDGEGLLDESVFARIGKSDKGMMLLRSRFFKCCAFNTKLQQWFADNNITDISQLNGITFATDIKDIVLVASQSCLKYLKMVEKKDSFEKYGKDIRKWCEKVEKDMVRFGIVKFDKRTRFFQGEMVETTYQLLNSLQLRYKPITGLIAPYIEYIRRIHDIRNTPEFIRFYLESEDLKGELCQEEDGYEDDSENTYEDEEDVAKELLDYSPFTYKNRVCLEAIRIDGRFKQTKLFKRRIFENIVTNAIARLYKGRTLVHGTYATLLGNPYEYLRYIILGEDGKPLFDKMNPESLFKENEIYSPFFGDGAELVGSRAPHITMGNVLYAVNHNHELIDKYFNLTRQIVVVDAINNNIQHRLSGCDYDSDTLLLSDDPTLVEAAKMNYGAFRVPVAGFKPEERELLKDGKDEEENRKLNLIKIDNEIANNCVGEIVNLSQRLNSHLWDRLNGDKNYDYSELYEKIAILSVLSGAEIDSAKRNPGFEPKKQYRLLSGFADTKNNGLSDNPMFFTKLSKKAKKKKKNKSNARTVFRAFKTSMDYIYTIVKESEFSEFVKTDDINISDLLVQSDTNPSESYYKQFGKVYKALSELKKSVDDAWRKRLNGSYDLEKETFDNDICQKFEALKTQLKTPEKTAFYLKRLNKLKKGDIVKDVGEVEEAGYTRLFLLLYIVDSFSEKLGYGLKDLFPKDAVPLPRLVHAKEDEEANYKLFNRFRYKVEK